VDEETDGAAQPDGSEAGVAIDDWRAYDAVIRLVAGAVGLGLERLKRIETALPEVGGPALEDRPLEAHWETVGSLIVGALADLPDRAQRSVEAVGGAAQTVAPIAAPIGFLARVTGIASLTERATTAIGDRVQAEVERLVALGRYETNRGVHLVTAVFDRSMDGIIDHIADSESLEELVHDQTIGVTAGAVREVRETGAAADRLTETIFRRIARRPVREPPRPSVDGP
jgi:hypothetical protein